MKQCCTIIIISIKKRAAVETRNPTENLSGNLQKLPLDLIYLLLSHLSHKEKILFASTCKALKEIVYTKSTRYDESIVKLKDAIASLPSNITGLQLELKKSLEQVVLFVSDKINKMPNKSDAYITVMANKEVTIANNSIAILKRIQETNDLGKQTQMVRAFQTSCTLLFKPATNSTSTITLPMPKKSFFGFGKGNRHQ